MEFGISEPLSEFNNLSKEAILQILKKTKELKEKCIKEDNILRKSTKIYESRLDAATHQDDLSSSEELRRLAEHKASLDPALSQAARRKECLKQQLDEASTSLEESIKQSKKEGQCAAKNTVDLYRDVMKIRWANKKDQSPHDINGLSFSKNKVKSSFHFNKEKQSNFFITNSLWAVGEQHD